MKLIKIFFEEPEIEILDSIDTNETSQHQENKQPIINNQFIFNQSGSGVNIGQTTNVIIKMERCPMLNEQEFRYC